MAVTDSATGAMGKYQLIAELGHGGMAQVFLARASGPAGFNKLIVIKQIRPQFAEDPDFLSMFLDEARLAARLNHPNVVQTNEVGAEDGRYFISMEYLEGQPLNRVLSRLGPKSEGDKLTLQQQLLILADTLAGLHHAHELLDFDGTPLAVVHRDMSPHNVFVTYAGQVKIVDFGIAKALSSSSETRTGVLKGKIGYMAPEQAMGEKVDRRADIFSCGMILWEMLTGRRMFKGVPDVAALQRIVSGDLPPVKSVVPDVPERLEQICSKALAQNRDLRYATAADMATDLEDAIGELGGKGTLRDVGRMIDKAFESERLKIKQLVEAHHAGSRTLDEPTTDGRGALGTGVSRRSRLPVIDSPSTESLSMATRREAPAAPATEPSTGTGANRPSPSSLTVNTAEVGAQPSGRGRVVMMALAAVAVGAALGVGVFLSRGSSDAAKPAASTSATVEAAPSTRTLRIESSPPGATVTDGAAVLGKTPLDVPLDPAAGTRHLVVSLEGYMPYALAQEPVKENVKLVVPLVPAARAADAKPTATATADTKPAKATPPPRVAPPPPQAPAKPPAAPPGDINMAR
ncbi:serine/threonine protein kinase [Minicystis rosea]|nr:serine/threonine protein kinase [Minicystis rosea]